MGWCSFIRTSPRSPARYTIAFIILEMHNCILYSIPLHQIFEHNVKWLNNCRWMGASKRAGELCESGVSRCHLFVTYFPVLLPLLACFDWSMLTHFYRQFFISQYYVEESIEYRAKKNRQKMRTNVCARECTHTTTYTHEQSEKDDTWKFWWCDVTQSVDKNKNYGIDLVEN